MQKLAAAYHKAYPKIPAPQVGGGQSDIGINGAASGRFDIGDSSRDPIKGVDPTGLVVHEDRPRRRVHDHQPEEPGRPTSPRKRSKASSPGRIHDWSEVPGATVSGPIDLFDRDGASGTQDAFQHIFLGET